MSLSEAVSIVVSVCHCCCIVAVEAVDDLISFLGNSCLFFTILPVGGVEEEEVVVSVL